MKLLWLIVVLTRTGVMCIDSTEREDTKTDPNPNPNPNPNPDPNPEPTPGKPCADVDLTVCMERSDCKLVGASPEYDELCATPIDYNTCAPKYCKCIEVKEKTFSEWEPKSPSTSDCKATGSDGNGNKCGTGVVTQHRTCQNGIGPGNTCSSKEELQRTKPCSDFNITLPECDPCDKSPCKKGSCKKINGESFTCKCDDGWEGDKCQFESCTMNNGTVGNGKTQGTCPDKMWCHPEGCKYLICKNGKNDPNTKRYCSSNNLDFCVYWLTPGVSVRTCGYPSVMEYFGEKPTTGCRLDKNRDLVYCLCDTNECN